MKKIKLQIACVQIESRELLNHDLPTTACNYGNAMVMVAARYCNSCLSSYYQLATVYTHV